RIDWKQEGRGLRWNRQMDFCVRAGEQRACWIVYIDFNQQRASRHIDGIGGAHQFSLKLAVWKLGQMEICCHTDFGPSRIFLRDVYVNAQFPGLNDVEEIGFHSAGAAGVNQVADIRVPSSDHAIERSVDLLKRHQCGVLVHGCLVCLDNRFVRVVSTNGIVDVLLGYSVAFQESLIAGLSDRSELEVCLRGEQVAAGLLELLVDFRSFDNGKQLALLDASSNVDIPLPQIPVGTGINRRRDEWLYISRKDDLFGGRALFWRNNRHCGEGDLRRFCLQRGAGLDTGQDARDQQGCDDDQRKRHAQPPPKRTLPPSHVVRWECLPTHLFFLFSFLRHNDSPQILPSAGIPFGLHAGAYPAER